MGTRWDFGHAHACAFLARFCPAFLLEMRHLTKLKTQHIKFAVASVRVCIVTFSHFGSLSIVYVTFEYQIMKGSVVVIQLLFSPLFHYIFQLVFINYVIGPKAH